MSSEQPASEKPVRRFPRRTLVRWGLAAVLALTALSWFSTWFLQRSLSSSSSRRAMQTWLDDTLNADVSTMGDMAVRINVLRDSRLVLHDVEIEHPNPLFLGRLAVVGRMGAWAGPLSMLGLWPGTLRLVFQNMQLLFEESDSGEWSSEGLLQQPLSSPDFHFPFPVPAVSGWSAGLRQSGISVRRRGVELGLGLNGEVTGRKNSSRIRMRFDKAPFLFGESGEEPVPSGTAGPAVLQFTAMPGRREILLPVPGRCETAAEGVPVAAVPFFVPGVPLSGVAGVFSGLIRYDEHPAAQGLLLLDGELSGVPLTVFGLPRTSAVRMEWPILPREETRASLRIGPSGFGAFEITVPLDASGRPRLLSLRGEVAALDTLPALFSDHPEWPDWLSRTFPSIEWRSGTWLGRGWSGTNMRLQLTRHTAGLSLTGEGEMMKGRVRMALNPDQPEGPLTVAGERLDAQLLAAKLSQMLPEAFRAHLTGTHANLTWMGSFAPDGSTDEWGTGLVFARPSVDLAASGEWWRGAAAVSAAIAAELAGWGGGDGSELRGLSESGMLKMEQLSIVGEKGADGAVAVEFRAYGESFGQAAGLVEQRPDGLIEGEMLLAGPSRMLDAAERANPDFGAALRLLAYDSLGLRITFRTDPAGLPVFSFPFLADARHIRSDLTGEGSAGP